uniref:Uncharacterized protein n=1 Tax=Anguilla anguilla TaxID=7936 RepID=A0A0E9WDM1_ANGAN
MACILCRLVLLIAAADMNTEIRLLRGIALFLPAGPHAIEVTRLWITFTVHWLKVSLEN